MADTPLEMALRAYSVMVETHVPEERVAAEEFVVQLGAAHEAWEVTLEILSRVKGGDLVPLTMLFRW